MSVFAAGASETCVEESKAQPKVLVANGERLDFDNRLDFTSLRSAADVSKYEASTPEQLIERAAGHTVIMTKEMPVSAETIAQLPASVRLIVEAGTGYNNVALDAAKEKGITVCNVPSYSTDAVAQLVVTYMLSFSCSLVQRQRTLLKSGGSSFGNNDDLLLPHFELAGKTLGLIGGGGSIGGKAADLATALGMNVLTFSRNPKPKAGVTVAASFEDLLRQSDFVSIHCPLTPSTKHLIDAAALRLMKPSAYLINTARGAIINEQDLIAALRGPDKQIAGAALDVQDPEPPAPDSPLLTESEELNVVVTPHIGWRRLETRQRLLDMAAKDVAQFLAGSPINVADKTFAAKGAA